ncbi:GspH/FimT family pseudopilin [Thiofaba sp. EF100]|uniref:GspH/FimT family pseudopilin n=1 Tax=Thiofaba sp. EF100 TaxID=3121274 RepID=UPI003221F8D0
MSPRIHPSLGGTLLELLVTLAVSGILLIVGVPSFEAMLARQRLVSTANDLLGEIHLARLEAIRLGRRVTLCRLPSSEARQCAHPNSTTGWDQGWMLFVDPQPQTPPVREAEGAVLRLQGTAPQGLKILGRSSSATSLFVSYTADGMSRLMNGGFLAGRLRVCSTSRALGDDERARDIVINAVGRAVIACPRGVPSSCPAPPSGTVIQPSEVCW